MSSKIFVLRKIITITTFKGDIGATLDNLETKVEQATDETQMSQVANESNQHFASNDASDSSTSRRES